MIYFRRVLWLLLCLSSGIVQAQSGEDVLASIAGHDITRAQLDGAVYEASRQRFYHGRVGDDQVAALRAEVLDELIDRVLLLNEAEARDLEPDADELKRLFERLQANYDMQAMPENHRAQLMPLLAQQAREQLLLKMLERQVRDVGLPGDAELERFYQENKEKFTTPPRLRLSVILLKVLPSSPVSAWRAAEEEAGRIRRKLMDGGDFAMLAEMHSGDSSAKNGGSLGLVHQGMLSEEAQKVVDQLVVGEISAPVSLLQGIALFRLDERQPAQLNPLAQVRERATGLWQRAEGEAAWQMLKRQLRSAGDVRILEKNILSDGK